MTATIVDLRYKTKKILEALDRRESVTLLYHGKVKGTIIPTHSKTKIRAQDHTFFGSMAHDKRTVSQIIDKLRTPRYRP